MDENETRNGESEFNCQNHWNFDWQHHININRSKFVGQLSMFGPYAMSSISLIHFMSATRSYENEADCIALLFDAKTD